MPSSTDYKRHAAIKLLIQGAPKSGKTTLALHWPKAWILDADNNLSGPIRTREQLGVSTPFNYDSPLLGPDGSALPPEKQWSRCLALTDAAKESGLYDTIIWDSLTTMSRMCIDYIMHLQEPAEFRKGTAKPKIQHYGDFGNIMTQAIVKYANWGKHFIAICHEAVDKDEFDQVLVYRPALIGQLKHTVGAFFSDVWSCETKPKGDDFEYRIRTRSTNQRNLGNSLGLPPSFVFNWNEIAKQLV